MRVAQRMVTRNYMKSLNTALGRRAESLERSGSGLKFKKLSENVADGTRAMRIQEERTHSQSALENVETILLEYNSVDSTMDSIDASIQTIQEKVLKAMSDSHGETNRDVLASEIKNLRDQILQFVNAQFADKYLFGGTNNAGPAFDLDSDGKVTFNGVKVEDIYRNADGKYCFLDAGGIEQPVPDCGDVYIDIGLGMKIDSGTPDPRTAFQMSFDSLLMLGYGAGKAGEKYGTPVAGNVIDLLTQLESAVAADNKQAIDDLQGQLVTLNDNMRMSRTDLGTRVNYLERTKDRLENDIDNLSEMESALISADPAEEAINMKMCEHVWLATLQLGTQILPSSLLDFLR